MQRLSPYSLFAISLLVGCFARGSGNTRGASSTSTELESTDASSTSASYTGALGTDTDTASTTEASAGASADASTGGSTDADTTTSTGAGQTTGSPAPVCGDGVAEGDEECDDANAVEADGCLSNCTREWFVFVTSEPWTQGDIKGLIGADYQCRHRAAKMFLPNFERYMAWISTSEVQPVDRLYHARGPYKLVNGLRVAADWDALLAGPLENPIVVSELGETVEALVFTGTQSTGERTLDTSFCADWTSNSGDLDDVAWYGVSSEVGQEWTLAVETFCAGYAALYCFEQP